jgi:hypothetical protein
MQYKPETFADITLPYFKMLAKDASYSVKDDIITIVATIAGEEYIDSYAPTSHEFHLAHERMKARIRGD